MPYLCYIDENYADFPDKRNVPLSGLMTDTVGFILKLPHHLVDAFRSTLEEARYADMLVHVVDASNPDRDIQMKVVYETLSELHISGKPILTIWNRFDILPAGEVLRDPRADQNVRFSAKTGEGKQQVFDAIQKLLEGSRIHLVEVIPYTESGKLSWIRQYGQLLKEEYEADGIHVEAYVPYV